MLFANSDITSHCSAGSQSTATPPPETCTYNLDRFKTQDVRDDAAIAGRLPTDAPAPLPYSLVPFYETRAAGIIADFVAAFNTGPSNN